MHTPKSSFSLEDRLYPFSSKCSAFKLYPFKQISKKMLHFIECHLAQSLILQMKKLKPKKKKRNESHGVNWPKVTQPILQLLRGQETGMLVPSEWHIFIWTEPVYSCSRSVQRAISAVDAFLESTVNTLEFCMVNPTNNESKFLLQQILGTEKPLATCRRYHNTTC